MKMPKLFALLVIACVSGAAALANVPPMPPKPALKGRQDGGPVDNGQRPDPGGQPNPGEQPNPGGPPGTDVHTDNGRAPTSRHGETHADESTPDSRPRRSERDGSVIYTATYNVVCRFGQLQNGRMPCHAAARLEKDVDDEGYELYDESSDANSPILAVECEGRKLYSEHSRRFTDSWGTRIQALAGPYPAIVLPKGALNYGHRRIEAWLELPDVTHEGSCFIYTGEAGIEQTKEE